MLKFVYLATTFIALSLYTTNCKSPDSSSSEVSDDQNLDASVNKEYMTLNEECKSHLAKPVPPGRDNQIRILSYNVLNLFDTKHDVEQGESKNDWEFMEKVVVDEVGKYLKGPKIKFDGCREARKISLDKCETQAESRRQSCVATAEYYYQSCLSNNWTTDNLEAKYKSIVDAFNTSMTSNGRPDIVILAEVENPEVVKTLGQRLGYISESARTGGDHTELDQCVYKGVKGMRMTTSPDDRGIDVALLYNTKNTEMKFVGCNEYNAEVSRGFDTRNILEIEFLVDGKHRLFVYGNHWPSQGSGTFARINVAKTLKKLMLRRLEEDPKASVIAAGDFNVTDNDVKPSRPFEDNLLKGDVIKDIWKLTESNNRNRPGTYYYSVDLKWHRLDRFFMNKGMLTGGLRVLPETFTVHNHEKFLYPSKITLHRSMEVVERLRGEGMEIKYPNLYTDFANEEVQKRFKGNSELEALEITENCAPNKFFASRGTGYSDHFPVSLVLEY